MYRFNFLALFCPVVTMVRLIGISVVMVFGTSTIMQMALAIPINFLALLYFSRAKPYSFKEKKYRIKNYIAIYHEACILIF